MGRFLSNTVTTGAVASTTTTLAAAALGHAEAGRPLGPINAVSHILWGEEAATAEQFDVSHTATGLALNAVAVTTWAGLHELLMPRTGRRHLDRALLAGTVVAGLAFVTDYYIVPKRLTPGFEKRLSNPSLLCVYGTLALSLAVGSLLNR